MPHPQCLTADLNAYPDPVVINLGMRTGSPRGLSTLLRAAFNAGDLGVLPELHDDAAWRVEYAHLGALQASSPASPSGSYGEQS